MWIDSQIIDQCQRQLYVCVWQPRDTLLVLGNGNDCQEYCYPERCRQLAVPILRRKGGGGAVVLHDGCIVVAVGLWLRSYFDNGKYFRLLNGAIIECLAEHRSVFAELDQQGISDICYRDKKVAGTSIFRTRNYLLYQASLLYRPRIDLVSHLLKQPPVAPAYRAGRTHADFLSSLNDLDPSSNLVEVVALLQDKLPLVIANNCGDELIEPPIDQWPTLQKRFEFNG